MKKIVVIDGQGGKLGAELIKRLTESFVAAEITAIGTNSIATSAMLKAGAKMAATGENPVIIASKRADIIIGPIGIVLADSLLGEITSAMANAVASSAAQKILIPMNKCSTSVAGVTIKNTQELIEDAILKIKELI